MLFKTSQYFKAFSVFPSLRGNFCEFCAFLNRHLVRHSMKCEGESSKSDGCFAAKNGAEAGGEYLNTKGRRS